MFLKNYSLFVFTLFLFHHQHPKKKKKFKYITMRLTSRFDDFYYVELSYISPKKSTTIKLKDFVQMVYIILIKYLRE